MEGRNGCFFTFEGQVGAREAGELREERGEGRVLACLQCGDGEGRSIVTDVLLTIIPTSRISRLSRAFTFTLLLL